MVCNSPQTPETLFGGSHPITALPVNQLTADTQRLGQASIDASHKALPRFLLDYVIEHGSTHGMVKAAAKHFDCGRSIIKRRIERLHDTELSEIETEQ